MTRPSFFIVPFVFFLAGCSSVSYFVHKSELPAERREAFTAQAIHEPLKQLPVGEVLDYDIRWMGIGVGSGKLEVRGIETYEGREVYHVVMEARSNSFLSAFYPVKDEIQSFIDTKELIPYKFRKIQREGGYRADEEMVYDQKNQRATYHSFLNQSTKEMAVPPNVQDALSILYYFRTLPLNMGESLFVDVNADEKNWRLEIKVLKSGFLKLMGKEELPAVLIEPLAKFHGVFIRKGRMQIWFTLDERRIPLYMKARIPFGIVEVVLKKEP